VSVHLLAQFAGCDRAEIDGAYLVQVPDNAYVLGATSTPPSSGGSTTPPSSSASTPGACDCPDG
jgi:hypothetical protein